MQRLRLDLGGVPRSGLQAQATMLVAIPGLRRASVELQAAAAMLGMEPPHQESAKACCSAPG